MKLACHFSKSCYNKPRMRADKDTFYEIVVPVKIFYILKRTNEIFDIHEIEKKILLNELIVKSLSDKAKSEHLSMEILVFEHARDALEEMFRDKKNQKYIDRIKKEHGEFELIYQLNGRIMVSLTSVFDD